MLYELDGSEDRRFGKLGANAALPVSRACCVAAAHFNKVPLYKYIS